jgi:hypothetical protein
MASTAQYTSGISLLVKVGYAACCIALAGHLPPDER